MNHHRRRHIAKLHEAGRAAVVAHHFELRKSRHVAEHCTQLRLAGVVAQVANEQGVAGGVVLGVGDLLEGAGMSSRGRRVPAVAWVVLLVAGRGRRHVAGTLGGAVVRVLEVHVLARHLRAQHRGVVEAKILDGILCRARCGAVGKQRKALRLVALPVHLAGLVAREEAQQIVQLALLHVPREAREVDGANLLAVRGAGSAGRGRAVRCGRRPPQRRVLLVAAIRRRVGRRSRVAAVVLLRVGVGAIARVVLLVLLHAICWVRIQGM
mmetsp:Transcript_23886/g.62043  ORF Transcript_23886/g.62043 Transcript_23886/m.62043 type:complete len:267 (+) Transcript_23886:219-1019(+)